MIRELYYQLPVYRNGQIDRDLILECEAVPYNSRSDKLWSRMMIMTQFPHPNQDLLQEGDESGEASLMSIRI